ncbi:outer membrane-stress sensor serine endopeptidase DegS [[Haemophilus] ducreyi]|uniref:outer membrane-stress sensor serine endopeptidase DegS n=1 Tax=Haemophilus ducreyi TaxID=730 RepID=UPI0006565909|nr:outer membrane-stress sensor serine endopeptidase DegS [[Haemophilus] ducreyi]AKO45568.1 peptidase [[Haemophilus] ducreyi]AKO46955.1 peptidase [[Haemophilus] ducreyi]AKO48298.1 peptidase [[Haemophilus] ducreyi]AKO49686.1 peptidase [[Haemophilus] ducreyi]ANF61290.1 outer membrane-stress sensor serine endopeptidase DegS [[Haemophilus] ducreyi]
MLKKIIRAAIFGLFCAFLILYVSPIINNKVDVLPQSSKKIASFHDAVNRASPAVVNVYNRSLDEKTGDFEVKNLGSGVVMTENGYILTNKHVIEDAEQIIVAFQTGEISDAKLVGADTLTDLAVLKVHAQYLQTIPQNDERPIRIGDIVLAIGNPFNLGQSISQGIISATGRNALTDGGRQNFIQTDASINRGNSGGALINSVGELIGINTLSLGKTNDELAEGLNFAIPINLAKQIMAKIIKDGRVIRGYFGVNSTLYSNAENSDNGVLITGVAVNGPADEAGIKKNDRILKIGNIRAVSPTQMMDVLANMKPGTQVNVQVLRDNHIFDVDVIIGEFPAL